MSVFGCFEPHTHESLRLWVVPSSIAVFDPKFKLDVQASGFFADLLGSHWQRHTAQRAHLTELFKRPQLVQTLFVKSVAAWQRVRLKLLLVAVQRFEANGAVFVEPMTGRWQRRLGGIGFQALACAPACRAFHVGRG